jgi:transcriptional regulator with XRE-family HTH domain
LDELSTDKVNKLSFILGKNQLYIFLQGEKAYMKDKEKSLDTAGLFVLLESSSTLDDVLQEHECSVNNPTIPSYLTELLQVHGYTIAQVIQRANLSKSFVYQIFSGARVPNRDILIRIAFAIKLNLEETQRLLTISCRGALYPRIRRDAAIIFCLQKRCTLEQTSELLEEIGEMPLVKSDIDE